MLIIALIEWTKWSIKVGAFNDIGAFVKEVMLLSTSVGALRSDVDKLITKIESHHDRIIRLENREELLMEKMTRHAVEAVHNMSNSYHERLAKIERDVEYRVLSTKQLIE